MENKISIIVPVYNVEKYVDKCLRSIIDQSDSNYEVIVVNDGSTDDSLKICKKYENENIRVFTKSNGGLSSARNYGISKAKGNYIAFVDSDDWIAPNYIACLNKKIQENDYDMIAFDVISINDGWESGDLIKLYYDFNENDKHEIMKNVYSPSYSWARIYKKELIENNKFSSKNYWYEDMYVMPKIVMDAKKIGYIEEGLYYYRQRQNSITSSFLNSKTLDVMHAWKDNLDVITKDYYDDYVFSLYKSIVSFIYFKPEYADEFLNFYKNNKKIFLNNRYIKSAVHDGTYEDLSKKKIIPKKLYYCWFGNGPKGKLFEKCYNSWKQYAPDFEIIELNEKNCDVNECRYVKQAYQCKKWAFVADYFRVKMLSKTGGIYVDTDIEFKKPIHCLTLCEAFFAFETCEVNGAIMGSIAKEKNINDILNSYLKESFILDNGSYNIHYPIPKRITDILKKNTNIILNGKYQKLDNVIIYPADVLTIDVSNDACIAEHLYEATWWDVTYGITSYRYTVLKYYFQHVVDKCDNCYKESFKQKIKKIILKLLPKRLKRFLKKILKRGDYN